MFAVETTRAGIPGQMDWTGRHCTGRHDEKRAHDRADDRASTEAATSEDGEAGVGQVYCSEDEEPDGAR